MGFPSNLYLLPWGTTRLSINFNKVLGTQLMKRLRNDLFKPDAVLHAFNPNCWEMEIKGIMV
jgi:hypothetical protein